MTDHNNQHDGAQPPASDSGAYPQQGDSDSPPYADAPTSDGRYGHPQSGPEQYGQPQYGQPQYGLPQYGQPAYGQAQYGQAQYGQAQYGQPQYPQGYPGYQKTNTLSIVAIILGFLVPPGGIICGHIALNQIKRTGENGRPLALTGLIAGYAITGIYLLIILFYIVIFITVIGGVAGASTSGYSS